MHSQWCPSNSIQQHREAWNVVSLVCGKLSYHHNHIQSIVVGALTVDQQMLFAWLEICHPSK